MPADGQNRWTTHRWLAAPTARCHLEVCFFGRWEEGGQQSGREKRDKPREPAAAAAAAVLVVVVRRGGGGEVTQGVRLMSRHLLTTAAGKEAAEELKPAV